MDSIYQYIKDNITKDGYLPVNFDSLPDDQAAIRRLHGKKIEPGAFEGMALRSTAKLHLPAVMNYLISRKISKQIKHPSNANRQKALYALSKHHAISIVDPIISFLDGTVDKGKMRSEALWLACSSDDRELVKVGIALLGQCGLPEDEEVLRTLACHEEFTLFAAVALKNIAPNTATEFLKDLSKRLNGWGKKAAEIELGIEPLDD